MGRDTPELGGKFICGAIDEAVFEDRVAVEVEEQLYHSFLFALCN
jgi:hypothetical protein